MIVLETKYSDKGEEFGFNETIPICFLVMKDPSRLTRN